MPATFELYDDRAGETRWRLRAANGRIIADSGEGYINKADAVHGIDLVRGLAPFASIEDLTDGDVDPCTPEYDLGELPAGLEIRWPELPTIDREETVPTTDGDTLRCNQPHTRYLIQADVDRVSVAACDVALQVADGARVGSVYVEKEVARVHFEGGRYGAIELAVPADYNTEPVTWDETWLVEDVLITDADIAAADGGLDLRGKRIAVLCSRIHAHRYSLWVGDTNDFRTEDLIVAGSELVSDGPEATLRMVGVQRSVVVDNVLSNPQKHNYRVEGRSDLAFAARNTFVDTGLMLASQAEDDVGTVWFRDNVIHYQADNGLVILDNPPGSQLRRFVASGNTIYSDTWDCFPCVETPPGWDVAEHSIQPYQPYEPRADP